MGSGCARYVEMDSFYSSEPAPVFQVAWDACGGLHLHGLSLVEEIGTGGFSTVYRAQLETSSLPRHAGGHTTKLEELATVAAKVFKQDVYTTPDAWRAVLSEVELAQPLSHPHTLQVFGIALVNGGFPAMVMELCPNGSLEQLLYPSDAQSSAKQSRRSNHFRKGCPGNGDANTQTVTATCSEAGTSTCRPRELLTEEMQRRQLVC